MIFLYVMDFRQNGRFFRDSNLGLGKSRLTFSTFIIKWLIGDILSTFYAILSAFASDFSPFIS